MNGNTAANGYGLVQHDQNGRLYLFVAGQPWFDFGYALPAQVWVHVALVRATGTWRLYVDGVPRGGTSTMTPTTSTQGTYLGSNGWSENFPGHLDDVRVYTRAVPASELQNLAGVLLPPAGSGCYYIKSQQTGYVLDVQWGSAAAGTSVIAWPQNSSTTKNQLWQMTPDGYIKRRLTGYVLKMQNDNISPEASLIVGSVGTTGLVPHEQRWTLVGDGYIRNRWTEFVVDVSGASPQPGAMIIAWPQNTPATPNQRWTLVPVGTCG